MLKCLRLILLFACVTVLMSHFTPPTLPPISLDRCPVPKLLHVSNVIDTSAIVHWMVSDSVILVDLQWRESGTTDWTLAIDVQSPFTLTDLDPCTVYEIRLRAFCNGSDSDFSPMIEFETDACCRIPTYVHVISATTTSATIGWDNVSFAFSHQVRYRAVGDAEWIDLESTTNAITIPSLEECTAYEIQVGSQCDLEVTPYSSSLRFQTVNCGACTDVLYCDAAADDATTEWIDSVSFGALRLRTGNNAGYLLNNTLATGIERKRVYSFHVTPAATFPGATFFLRMWIDFNQDGSFTDSTELLVDPVDAITIDGWSQQLVISDTVQLGMTRMRIALKSAIGLDTIRPSGCGNFLFGEVEDYCISIDDVCPEVQPFLESHTETSAVISWPGIEESVVFVYRYREINETDFSEPELTQDTIIEISGLEKCKEYLLQTLNVCVQDTSSWLDFYFETTCPNAVRDVLPVAVDVNVFPNPFNDHLTLTLQSLVSGKATLRLFDIMGHELIQRPLVLVQDEEQIVRFDALNDLHHGIYLLSLDIGNRRQIFKVVK